MDDTSTENESLGANILFKNNNNKNTTINRNTGKDKTNKNLIFMF